MQTIAQLSEDLTCLHCLIQYDPETQPPLAELYSPPFVARMLEVTAQNPVPQPGWLAADVIKDVSGQVTSANFAAPPGPTLIDRANQLHGLVDSYIYAHYSQGTQASLIALATSMLAVLINPASTADAKSAAAATNATIQTAWDWVTTVLAYYYALQAQLSGGAAWESLDLNFATHFDAADPKISLQTLLPS